MASSLPLFSPPLSFDCLRVVLNTLFEQKHRRAKPEIQHRTITVQSLGHSTNPRKETELMETVLIRASISLSKIEADLLGSWWP